MVSSTDKQSTVSDSNVTPTKTPPPDPSEAPPDAAQAPVQLTRARFVLIFLSLMLCVFLFALDQLIVATAIPKITDQFHSLTQISWLANGFFVTLLAFNLAFAQWLSIFPAKHVTLFAVFIFELGSLLCGAAPNMIALIIGRAIAGLGGTGIFNGALMVLTEMTTFAERAKYFGLMGVCFAVASILGPLVGGAFSDHVSWRWCFYINLPIGGVALILIVLLVETRPPYGRAATYKGYGWDMLKQLAACDWMGVAIVLSWGICFILALEWGGITKAWNDPNVIACLVMSLILPVLFVAWEKYMGEKAMLPLYMLKIRSVAGGAAVAVFTWAPFMFCVYYLSEGYQAVYHSSATRAGIDLLPQIVTQIFVLIATGRIIARFGRPYWIIVAGPCFLILGSGLLYSVEYPDSKSYYLGYSAIIGVGIGCVLQNTIIAVQYVFHKKPQLISIGTGTVTFFGFVGRNLGISLAGSVFGNMLQVNLHHYAPGLPPQLVAAVQNNAGAVYSAVPEPLRPQVLKAYMKTLSSVFIIGVPSAAIALVGALIMDNSKMDMSQGAPTAAKGKKPADIEQGSTIDADADDDNKENGEKEVSAPSLDARHQPSPHPAEEEKLNAEKEKIPPRDL